MKKVREGAPKELLATSKFEYRNPKFETIPNDQNPNDQNVFLIQILDSRSPVLIIGTFENSNLFRMSCFEFRVLLYIGMIALEGLNASVSSSKSPDASGRGKGCGEGRDIRHLVFDGRLANI
jgi:hypothetical protein